jgi:hypothetical protein
MSFIKYHVMPMQNQWFKDTPPSAASAGKTDTLYAQVSDLIGAYHSARRHDGQTYKLVLCEMFHVINQWNKRFKEGDKALDKSRYPAMMALFDLVLHYLKPVLGVTSDMGVANKMRELFGKHMTTHGVYQDYVVKSAKYLTELEANLYRLHFRSGRALQYGWWMSSENGPSTLVPAQSKEAYVHIVRDGSAASVGYGGFIMTLEREFFMAKHSLGNRGGLDGVFHSSYCSGGRVGCAGTMLIVDGEVRAIRNDSGHYEPTKGNVVHCLQALKMNGVEIDGIEMYNFDGTFIGRAPAFMRAYAEFGELMKFAKYERADAQSMMQKVAQEQRFARNQQQQQAQGGHGQTNYRGGGPLMGSHRSASSNAEHTNYVNGGFGQQMNTPANTQGHTQYMGGGNGGQSNYQNNGGNEGGGNYGDGDYIPKYSNGGGGGNSLTQSQRNDMYRNGGANNGGNSGGRTYA